MAFVLDCSTTMTWCFADEANRYADRALDAMPSSEVIVPSIWALEVINVLLVAERQRRLTEADTVRFLDLLGSLPIRVEERDASVVFGSVLACGRRFGLSSYDAAYLDLAMRAGALLATSDRKLRRACRAAGVGLFGK